MQREREEKKREYKEKLAAFLNAVEARNKEDKGKEEEKREMEEAHCPVAQSSVRKELSQTSGSERGRRRGGNMWSTARQHVVRG